MRTGPLFSIVIPVYKTEAYLARCVDSALNQTFSDIEIVLVDDGSPDNCPALCDGYGQKDGRVRVIHKKNGGLSDARNAGIEAAVGEYILFLDSDDYLERDACERFVPAAQTGSDVLIGRWIKGHTPPEQAVGENFVKVWNPGDYIKHVSASGYLSMGAVQYVLSRQFLLRTGLRFPYGILHEDVQFTPRMLLAAQSLAQTDVEFYHYILREDSITTGKDLRKNAQDHWATCQKLEQMYTELEDRELARYLQDTLVMQTLSLFQTGRLYQYGGAYIHRSFVMRNAFKLRTRVKAALYCLSPRLYWAINNYVKRQS